MHVWIIHRFRFERRKRFAQGSPRFTLSRSRMRSRTGLASPVENQACGIATNPKLRVHRHEARMLLQKGRSVDRSSQLRIGARIALRVSVACLAGCGTCTLPRSCPPVAPPSPAIEGCGCTFICSIPIRACLAGKVDLFEAFVSEAIDHSSTVNPKVYGVDYSVYIAVFRVRTFAGGNVPDVRI